MSKTVLAMIGSSVLFVGCYPAAYTHIEQVDDGYMVTKNEAGFIRTHGELLHCKPEGSKMKCKEVGHK